MTDTTSPTALNLLKRAEALLSALHGSVARHDSLAANLGCAGCELRDQISAALPSLAAAPAVLAPAADRANIVAAIKASPFQELRSVDHAANGPLQITVKVDDLADVLLRRLADEQQPGTTAFSPGEGVHGRDPYYASSDTEAQQQADTRCGPVPDQCDAESGEPCAKHEREQAHTEGDHTFCGPECAAACTCGVAGDCFVPAGHYADCPCPEARQQHGPAPAPVAVQPPADTTGEEAQPRFVRVCTPCPQCDTLDEDGACANGCTPPAVVAEPGKEN